MSCRFTTRCTRRCKAAQLTASRVETWAKVHQAYMNDVLNLVDGSKAGCWWNADSAQMLLPIAAPALPETGSPAESEDDTHEGSKHVFVT